MLCGNCHSFPVQVSRIGAGATLILLPAGLHLPVSLQTVSIFFVRLTVVFLRIHDLALPTLQVVTPLSLASLPGTGRQPVAGGEERSTGPGRGAIGLAERYPRTLMSQPYQKVLEMR